MTKELILVVVGWVMQPMGWKTEATKLIIETLNRLPKGQREAFVYKHYQGLSTPEIAEKMQCSVEETSEILKNAEHQLSKNLKRMDRAFVNASFAFC